MTVPFLTLPLTLYIRMPGGERSEAAFNISGALKRRNSCVRVSRAALPCVVLIIRQRTSRHAHMRCVGYCSGLNVGGVVNPLNRLDVLVGAPLQARNSCVRRGEEVGR